jgi:hypothetical protein
MPSAYPGLPLRWLSSFSGPTRWGRLCAANSQGPEISESSWVCSVYCALPDWTGGEAGQGGGGEDRSAAPAVAEPAGEHLQTRPEREEQNEDPHEKGGASWRRAEFGNAGRSRIPVVLKAGAEGQILTRS